MNLNRLRTTRSQIGDAATSGLTTVTTSALVSGPSQRVRVAMIGLLAAMAALGIADTALAQANCSPTDGDATGKIVQLISRAGTLLIAIGGIGALLMFAIGAIFIMFGGNESRTSKGMKMVKNTVIGLAVLAGGFFLRNVVTSFVDSANSNVLGAQESQTGAAGLTNCDFSSVTR